MKMREKPIDIKSTKFWLGILLGVVILLFSMFLMPHASFIGLAFAITACIYLLQVSTPSEGRIIGVIVGGIDGILSGILLTPRIVIVPDVHESDVLLQATLVDFVVLSVIGFILGDFLCRVIISLSKRSGGFFF